MRYRNVVVTSIGRHYGGSWMTGTREDQQHTRERTWEMIDSGEAFGLELEDGRMAVFNPEHVAIVYIEEER